MSLSLLENAPSLEANIQISKQNIKDYKQNGFVKINDICTKNELEFYRNELMKIVNDFQKTKLPLNQRDTYGKAFLQISNIWQIAESMKPFVLAKRFGKIAADLMGCNGVRIYHDQALYKEAGGGHTPWHQDQFYWPTEDPRTITMWMPMVDTTNNMGLMEFVAGTHKSGMLYNIEISDNSDRIYHERLQTENWDVSTFDFLSAGSATFHSGWTLHRAGPNTTSKLREVMTIIFIADDIKISNPKNKAQENDLKTWFPGQKPGEIATSPLNPLVYQQ